MASFWEDCLIERKVESDLKDLLKTLVAFANTVRPGHVARILIGEMNDGSVQGVTNPDNIQKKIRSTCDDIYPPILWRSTVYEREGKPCVEVEIEYSGETPHFGGTAWIRKGSETIKAPDEVFQRLIEFRLSKTREIALWIDRTVTVVGDLGLPRDVQSLAGYLTHPRLPMDGTLGATLLSVNSFWVTLEYAGSDRVWKHSEPLDKVVLSWDDENDRLKLLVKV